jgi:anti-sigma B factor antagonist
VGPDQVGAGRCGGAVVVSVSGDADVLTAPRLRDALDRGLAEAVGGPVLLDLTDVGFLASRGLSTIVDAHQEAGATTPLRVVVDHARPVVRPIQLSGLDAERTLFGTVEDALDGGPEVDVRRER